MSGVRRLQAESEDIGLFPRAIKMVAATDRVFDAIVVNKARAKEELEERAGPRR